MTSTLLREAEPKPAEALAPGRRHTTWVLVGCLALLAAWSGPGLGWWPLTITGLSACGLLGLGVYWLVLIGQAAGTGRRLATRFAVGPLLVVVTAALLHANLPTLARFRLTEGAFDQSVQEGGAFAGRWLGSYRIDEARTIGDGTFFFDRDSSLFGYAGFAYLPTGPSPSMASRGFESPQFRHLYGHWWTFSARF